jgi:ribonucleoside-diphosphate reductase alpha chain
MRFEPQGHTKNPDIRIAKSLIDYIFRWLGITFLPGYKEASMGQSFDAGASAPAGGAGSPPSDNAGETGSFNGPVAKKADGRTDSHGAPAVAASSLISNGTNSKGHGANGHATNGHATNGQGVAKPVYSAKSLERAGAMIGEGSRNEQFAGFQVDAPACDNCGAITVRNGNCYLCHNCGASMGCS